MKRSLAEAGASRALLVALVSFALLAFPSGLAFAQAPCVADKEPNDRPESAMAVAGAFCIEGSVGENDQDLFAWTVSAADAAHGWSIDLDGIAEQQTKLQIHRIDEPARGGSPASVSSELWSIATAKDGTHARAEETFVTPGQYLVGLSVSGGQGAYTIRVAPAPLPDAKETEPNDSKERATAVSGAFAIAGDLAGSDDWYAWSVSASEARQRWTLALAAPIGVTQTIEIFDPGGAPLLRSADTGEGELSLFDLALAAGTYRVHVGPAAPSTASYVLRARTEGPRLATREDEPNDTMAQATPLAVGKQVGGRLGRRGDVDYFSVAVDDTTAKGRLDVALTATGPSRHLCLIDPKSGIEIQCRDGASAKLAGLSLEAGSYAVSLAGGADPGAPYTLAVRRSAAPGPDAEREPNDSQATAMPLGARRTVRGHLTGLESDTFEVTIEGAAQLWTVRAEGRGVKELDVLGAQGLKEGVRLGADGTEKLEIAKLFLTPGKHWIAVEGADADYAISLEPTGLPDPNAEREPNDGEDKAERLRFGVTRTGSISESNDTDTYRFSTTTTEHLALRVEPPAGQDLFVNLSWASSDLGRPGTHTHGAPVVWDAVLPPDDYYVELGSSDGSPGSYRISLERRDPFDVGPNIEPSNTPGRATPFPDSLSVKGEVGVWANEHWYRLPALREPSGVRVRSTGQVSIRLVKGTDASGNEEIALSAAADGSSEAELPAGVGTLLCVTTTPGGPTPFGVDVSFTRGVTARPAGGPLPVKLAVALASPQVASYWIRGQQVHGTATLTNDGPEPVDLALAARVTSSRADATLARETVHLDAKGRAAVPFDVHVAADAFTDPKVLVAVRARATSGAQVSAVAPLAIDPDAPPLAEEETFALPAKLLGGFDIASAALGGTPVTAEADPLAADVPLLFDGLVSTFPFRVGAGDLPAEVTVAFGGDRPWPVAGIVLDPATSGTEALAGFELLLSEDGVRFTTALTGELRSDDAEQGFVLPQVRSARAARLRFLSNHAGNLGETKLAEWKVVTPGGEPAGLSLDLADPRRGGHVVWSRPVIGDAPEAARDVLQAGGPSPVVALEKGGTAEWVVGFADDRAAQLVSLRWIEEPPINTAKVLDAVEVSVSTESALGPWTTLGTWKLERKGGALPPWKLAQPAWARFVRFASATPAADGGPRQLPTKLEILERATGGDYRSVLGEWGRSRSQAIYEMQRPAPPAAIAEADHNDKREEAQRLALGAEVAGDVLVHHDEDWYALDYPGGAANTLELTLGGEPSVDVEVTVEDESGKALPLRVARAAPRQLVFESTVAGPRKLFAKVSEPPHSVAIAYDTSGSLMGLVPIVFDGIEQFASGVVPGMEVVNFMPFDKPMLLDDWSDQPYVLQAALAADTRESTTSGSETTLIAAARALSERRGARAILLLTDASTTGYAWTADLWQLLGTVRPRVFTAHIGRWDDPLREKQLMQDWSMAYSGYYTYSPTRAEMEVAFERVATWLRRPARYRLSAAATTHPPPGPGSIQVVAAPIPKSASEEGTPPAESVRPARGAVELIFDASGSMLQRFEGKRRIDVAHQVLTDLVTKTLPAGLPLALRAFGNDRPGSCETQLVQALAPLEPKPLAATIAGIQSINLARTALGASLKAARDDLADVEGPRTIVVVTDGEETCGGDPRREIDALVAEGWEVHVNIVGFAVNDAKLKDTFRDWAKAGGGQYFDAQSSRELSAGLRTAMSPAFRVVGADGAEVARGTVGGDAVTVPAGIYRVEVEGASPARFESVSVDEGKITRVDYTGAKG